MEENPVQTYSTEPKNKIVTFNPRDINNIQIVDEMQNLAPINDMKVEDLTGEGNPQIYLACGRGAQGALRILRHGLTVVEMAVSPMPNKPVNIITVKSKIYDLYDKYMIVSFPQSTLILSIGEDKVAEEKYSGFYTNERTLHAGILEDNSYV